VSVAANPKRLRIVGARALGAGTRALAVQCVEGDAFDRAGGKYVIVHTGLVVGDKPIKRAYSLVPVAGAPSTFELTVKRLDGGPGSNALHDAPVGTELGFSGPWGKLVPEGGLPPRTLLVATDTGITSALGVVEEHGGRGAVVLWLREEHEPFLDVGLVRQRVESAGARFLYSSVPGAADAARGNVAFARIDGCVGELSPELVIATGDGRVVHPLVDRLRPIETRIECYFHNPEKKSAP
jgi:ferredoxin-NADP reductase